MRIIPAAGKHYAFLLGLALILLWAASEKREEMVPELQVPVSPKTASLPNRVNAQDSITHKHKKPVPKATNPFWSEAPIAKVLDSDLQLLPDGTGWLETVVIETNNRIKWLRIESLHKWDNASREYALVSHKPAVANEALIKLENENDLTRILLDNELRSAKRLTKSGWFRVELTNFKTVADLPKVLKNIRRNSESTIIAEPDYIISQTNTVPNDPLYELQWHLDANQGINAPAGWDIQKEASDVIIAVIDSGIRATHEDLKDHLWINADESLDGLDNDNNGFIDDIYGIDTIENSGNPADPSGHGTLVSGVIAAGGNNSVGVTGTTWNSRIMALRFMDENGLGTTADAIECLQYAVSKGANIINMSWGGHGRSQALEDLLNECNDNGILCVASAGNSGVNIDSNPTYPGAFDLPNLITVAASNELLELADFSNWGPNKVHIAAPGKNIRSTTSEGDTTYGTFTGTSAAAPILSGMAALALAKFGKETPDRLKERLLQSSKLNNTLNANIVTGGNADLHRLLTEQNNRPSNDDFAEALALTPFRNTVQSSLKFGNFELTEPNPQQVDNPKSLWFSFKAEHSSGVGIQVSARSFLPILNVYSGGADLESLVLEGTSKRINTLADLRFATRASQTYYIQLYGPSSAGSFDLRLLVTPPNDDFRNATILSGDLFSAEGNNLNATSQIDEPPWDSRAKGQSLWWQYTPTRSGNFYLTTTGSETDTLLAVFRGTRLNKIHLLDSNDDQIPGFFTSGLSFDVSAGETYYFLVDSAYEPGGRILLSGQYQSTPRFVVSPKDTTTSLGSEVTLSGIATGPKPIRYQWKKDSENLPFANSPELTISPVAQSNLGSYQLEVTSPGGSIISDAVTLSLSGKPLRILLQPESYHISLGETTVLRVLVEGKDLLNYQWFKDFTPITGATSNSLLVDSVTRGSGLYFVEIKDSNGTIRSAVAEVSVTDSMQPLGSVRSSIRGSEHIDALIYYNGGFIAGGADGSWQIMNPSGQWISQPRINGDSSSNTVVEFVEGNGLLIAVFQSGALAVTSDLKSWTIVPAQQGGLGYIGMVSKDGVFLRTDGADNVLRSVDGVNWEIVLNLSSGTELPGVRLRDIAEANGYFAALEASNDKLIFHRSLDGTNWESFNGPEIPGSPYAYSLIGGPYFYVNSEQEHEEKGYYSTDGNLWKTIADPPALISVIEAQNQFFATTREGNILKSNDGIEWTSVWSTGYRDNPSKLSLAHGDGSFLVGPVDGTLFKLESFAEVFLPDFRGGIGGDNIHYMDNQFVGVSDGWIYRSKTGASWENIPFENDFTGNVQGIAFGNGIYTFGNASGPTLDSITVFQERNPDNIKPLAFGNGVFLASSNNGLQASIDGRKWEIVHLDYSGRIEKILFANDRFIAVGSDKFIAYSINGYDWSSGNISGSLQYPHDWLVSAAYGNGKYVAVGQLGRILESSDGITWNLLPVDLRNFIPGPHESLEIKDSVFWDEKFNFLIDGYLIQSADLSLWKYKQIAAHDLVAMAAGDRTLVVTGYNKILQIGNPPGLAPYISYSHSNRIVAQPEDTVSLEVTAIDADGAIESVTFLFDGAKIGERTEKPYSIDWNVPGMGTYLITAIATDNSGMSSRDVVQISSNQKPTIEVLTKKPGINENNLATLKGSKYLLTDKGKLLRSIGRDTWVTAYDFPPSNYTSLTRFKDQLLASSLDGIYGSTDGLTWNFTELKNTSNSNFLVELGDAIITGFDSYRDYISFDGFFWTKLSEQSATYSGDIVGAYEKYILRNVGPPGTFEVKQFGSEWESRPLPGGDYIGLSEVIDDELIIWTESYEPSEAAGLYVTNDLKNWEKINTPYSGPIANLLHANEVKILTRTDGAAHLTLDEADWVEWSENTYVTSLIWKFGKYLMATQKGLFSSPDGLSWTLDSANEIGRGKFVDLGDRLYIIEGYYFAAYTDDGNTWNVIDSTQELDPYKSELRSIAYGNVGYVGLSLSYIAYSENGSTWSFVEKPEKLLNTIAFGNGLYVATTNGQREFATSIDGINWEYNQYSFANGYWLPGKLFFMESTGLFVLDNNGFYFTSPDGYNWTPRNYNGKYSGVTVIGDTVFTWIRGDFGTNQALGTSDGINWITLPENLNGIHYQNSIYLSSGKSPDQPLYKSTDGINWSSLSSPVGLQGTVISIDSDGFYVSFHSRFELPHEGIHYYTQDGETWTEIPTISVNSNYLLVNGQVFYVDQNLSLASKTDLKLAQVDVDEGVYSVGHTIDVLLTLTNRGDKTVSLEGIKVFGALVQQDEWNGNREHKLTETILSQMEIGREQMIEIAVKMGIPSGILPGDYGLQVWLNPDQLLPETRADNNFAWSNGLQIHIPEVKLKLESSLGGSLNSVPSKQQYAQGETVALVARPLPKYRLSSWTGVDQTAAETATIKLVGNRVAGAVFERVYYPDISIAGSGKVYIMPDKAQFTEGEVVSVSATANEGWVFTGWSGPLSGSKKVDSFEISSDVILQARFAQDVEAWQTQSFSSEQLLDNNISALDSDPDLDGFSNTMEYFFGTNPLDLSDFPNLQFSKQGDNLVYRIEQGSTVLGYDVVVESSDNLKSWYTIPNSVIEVGADRSKVVWDILTPYSQKTPPFQRLRLLPEEETEP